MLLYRDLDEDGFVDSMERERVCPSSLENGYANEQSNLPDCDDSDPSIHPDSTKICDGVDNNSNTLIDDDDPNINLVE